MTEQQKSLPLWILIVSGLFALLEILVSFLGISQKENSLIMSAIVMCIISSAMLFVINRRR